MASFNKVILAGNLCKDPEIRYTQSSQAICNFSMAINNGKDKNGTERPADFFDCEAWEKTAELISEYLKKGSSCLIEGRLKQDRWEDEHGNKRSRVKVVVQNIQFLGKKDDGGSGSGNADAVTPDNSGGAPF